MSWWGWVVIGAILLGAELFVVEADFYLVFLGISAVLVGLIATPMPMWAQWLTFAAVSLVSMLFFRRRVYRMVHRGSKGLEDNLVGKIVRLPERVAPGESCRVEHHGSTWTARNEGATAVEAGSKARVTGVDGVVLRVQGI
jgi:membrane protein implicated in regulation of membrane protease activity